MGMHRRLLAPVIALLLFALPLSAAAQKRLPELVKRVLPSIVVVITYDEEGKVLAQGSGFFISRSGDIITSRHVLQGAHRAEVKTAEGKTYPIRLIVAEDKEGDLVRASVDIPEKAVRALSVSSRVPEVGEQIIVVGSPLGLQQTVSEGIVSAIREFPHFGRIIQINAPVSPGSSGSPVIDTEHKVIGVVTFLVPGGQNLNLAVPAERVTRLTPGKGKTLAEWRQGTLKEWLSSAEGLYLRGLRFFLMKDCEKALLYFEQAVRKAPLHADAHFYIGYCCTEIGRYAEANEAFKQAIRLKRDFAEAHFGLGLTYGVLGRHTEAIKAYKQAIRLKPDFVLAHLTLGLTYRLLGRYAEAIEAYKQAIRIKPNFAEAHLMLGLAYLEIGDRASALDEYKILKDLNEELANELFDFIYK